MTRTERSDDPACEDAPRPTAAASDRTCRSCHAANPPTATRCSRCTSPLPDEEQVPTTPGGAPTSTRRRILLGAKVVAVLALVAVGGVLWFTRPHMLDTDKVARTIGERISHQVGETVTVACPSTARRNRGETFRCSATSPNGPSRTVVVTVTDDRGTVTWHTRG